MRWICERSVPLQKRKRVLLSSLPKVTRTCSDFHEHDIRYVRRGVGAMDFVCFRSHEFLARISVIFWGGGGGRGKRLLCSFLSAPIWATNHR